MSWLRQLLFRLQPLFRRRKIEREFADEIRTHLAPATEAHLAAGLTPAEARCAAEREFGGIEQIKEACRDARSFPWLDQLCQDVRAAFRSLRKTPAFTAVAVLSLAAAIGVNTTVFSLVNGLILRPLAPRHDASIDPLYVSEQDRSHRPFSHAEYVALREARDTFTDVAATFPTFASVAHSDGLHRGVAFFVSENYFSMLGLMPLQGRFFSAEECRPDANIPVVVASHAFWQRLGGRPDFLGSTLRINGRPYTVIGIAPPPFNGLNVFIGTDCWAPLGVFGPFGGSAFGESQPDLSRPGSYTLFLVARLAPPATLESVASRLPGITLRGSLYLQVRYASTDAAALDTSIASLRAALLGGEPEFPLVQVAPFTARVNRHVPLQEARVGAVLLGSFGEVALLLAIIDIYGVKSYAIVRRTREIGIRLALGASPRAAFNLILRQGLLQTALALAVGALLALGAGRLFGGYVYGLSGTDPIALLAEALVLGLAAFVACWLPARRATKVDPMVALRCE